MAITEKHIFGWARELALQAAIQVSLGEAVRKTPERYATFDWNSDHYNVELKSRPDGSSKDWTTWLVSVDKTIGRDGRKPVLFYYWAKDKTLWRCFPDDWNKDNWMKHVPHWKETQEHYWIPRECFSQIPLRMVEDQDSSTDTEEHT